MTPKTPMNTEEISEDDKRAITKIAKNIKNNNCVLFLGAGVNACNKENEQYYPIAKRPPMASELAKILKDELKDEYNFEFKDENNITLSRIAQYYELKSDRLNLASTLKRCILDGKEPSPVLYDLAEMPFEFIITTNYDQLFEEALKSKNKSPQIKVYHSDRQKKTDNIERNAITKNAPFLYKIHGDIDDENRQSMVITDEDYINFILRMSDKDDYNPIPHVFTDALCQKSILFIGYRLMDYNLRLLFKTIRWGKDPISMPLNYSIDPAPDILIEPLFSTNYRTNFLVLDSWKIIPLLYNAVFE